MDVQVDALEIKHGRSSIGVCDVRGYLEGFYDQIQLLTKARPSTVLSRLERCPSDSVWFGLSCLVSVRFVL